MEMTTDSHGRGSKRCHKQRKEDSRAIGREHMSQEEFDREIVELKERLSIIMKLLHESEEDQR